MTSTRKTDYLSCQTCGKQLQARRCYDCQGNGTTRYLLFFGRTCETCNGSGILYECPDQILHSRALETKIFSEWMGIQPMVTKHDAKQKCWVCGGKGSVQKSVHIPRTTDVFPMYPRKYKIMKVPCSNCNGRGWIA